MGADAFDQVVDQAVRGGWVNDTAEHLEVGADQHDRCVQPFKPRRVFTFGVARFLYIQVPKAHEPSVALSALLRAPAPLSGPAAPEGIPGYHRNDFLLGSVGTNAVLDIDGVGVRYTVDLLETRSAEEVYAWVKSGVVTGSSFSVVTVQDDWDWVGGVTQRTLISGMIRDLDPTPAPAYLSSTSITLRSLATHRGADYADVESLAAQGELRKLWERTDNIQSAPSPALESRGGGMDIATARKELERMDPRRQLSNKQRRAPVDQPHSGPGDRDPGTSSLASALP